MKKALLHLIGVIILLGGCDKKGQMDIGSFVEFSPSAISMEEVLFRFEDKYPWSIQLKESLLFITLLHSDTIITVLDLNTKKVIDKFGTLGQGPSDIMDPERVLSINNSDIYYNDVNTKKLLKVNTSADQVFELERLMVYPYKIYPSSLINYSDTHMIGRKIKLGSEKDFYIYDIQTDSIVEIDTYPYLKDISDPNYYCASHLAMNTKKDRIITGKYFMDIINVYDMTGERIKTIHFSKNPIPEIDKKNKALNMLEGYTGFQNPYCTNDFLYIKRINKVSSLSEKDESVSEIVESVIIKMDWDGNLIRSYRIDDDLTGEFCIDEKKNILYAIKHSIEGIDNEFYDIVSYRLD